MAADIQSGSRSRLASFGQFLGLLKPATIILASLIVSLFCANRALAAVPPSETVEMNVTARVALSPIYAVLIAKNSQVTVDYPNRRPGQEAVIQVASRGLAGRPLPESRLALEVINPAGQVVFSALLTADHLGISSLAMDTTTLLGTYQIRVWDLTYGPRIRLESSVSINIEPYQPTENPPAADQATGLAASAVSLSSPASLAIPAATGPPDWAVSSAASTRIEAQAFSPIRARAGPG